MKYPITHPENFGKWKVKEHLAAAGQFSLYVVTDSTKDDPPERLLKTPFTEYIPKVRFEAELLQKLEHPNIIELIDCDLEADPIYEVTEYGTQSYFNAALTDWKLNELAPHYIKEKCKAITNAVGYLHSQGITHNNLQQTHIVICEDGTPKLIHFEDCKIHSETYFDTSKDITLLTETLSHVRAVAAGIVKKENDNNRQARLERIKTFTPQSPKALTK